jgi:hypothetical protein
MMFNRQVRNDHGAVVASELAWGRVIGTVLGSILLFTVLFFGCGASYKSYNRYQKRADSKNALWRAQYEKKIQVEDAEGQRLAATKLAAVEIERAKGVAEANRIIAGSLNEQYLRYFYISTLSKVENSGGRIIYVPTEAGLPILEAGRATDGR